MRQIGLIGAVIFVVTLAVYWQVGHHDFIILDDAGYIFDNAHITTGLTKDNIVWAATAAHAGNWHPLTWVSHMADVELYGLNPRGHHLTNVGIHATATLLLLALFFRMTGKIWHSAFIAAIFALHPLHVESVAWASERKDVLSALFCWLTLLLYAEYATSRNRKLYCLTLGAFILGLMSKPMLVTLPILLLLIDFWPLNRLSGLTWAELHPLLKEKFPFAACSLASATITIYAQQQGAAIASISDLPLGLRLANALTAYVRYIGKALWPTDLAIIYPFPAVIPPWQPFCALLTLATLTAACLRYSKRHPYLITGWLWFLISLLPVIGLIQVGVQSMADRYTYIPMVGLSILAAWGMPALIESLPQRKALLALLGGTAVVAATAATVQQIPYWRDSITLFEHAIAVTTDNPMARHNLGLALAEDQKLDLAIEQYRKAIEANPNFTPAYNQMGFALAKKGFIADAIGAFEKVIQLDPNFAEAYYNLGLALSNQGQIDKAAEAYKKVISIDPSYVLAYNNLGVILARNRHFDEAILLFQQALQLKPDYLEAKDNLQLARQLQNQN